MPVHVVAHQSQDTALRRPDTDHLLDAFVGQRRTQDLILGVVIVLKRDERLGKLHNTVLVPLDSHGDDLARSRLEPELHALGKVGSVSIAATMMIRSLIGQLFEFLGNGTGLYSLARLRHDGLVADAPGPNFRLS